MRTNSRHITRFAIIILLYGLFVLWIGFYWLFLGLILILDICITRILPWSFLHNLVSKNKALKEFADWISAILIALIFVIFIRTLFIEAYTIPTPSMENTLMVGDYLFVSKIAYGPKLPNTPLAFPFTHNSMPFSSKKSYSEKVKWSYKRLKGIRKIRHNDVVVFHFPEGDTVVPQFPDQNYYTLANKYGRPTILNQYDVITRPVDKRENFVKRCVALPGDSLLIKHSDIYINGIKLDIPASAQHNYYVRTAKDRLNQKEMDSLGILSEDKRYNPNQDSYILNLTQIQAQQLRELSSIKSVKKLENTNKKFSPFSFFPYSQDFPWNEDNFGPLLVPAKEATVQLTRTNLPLYRRIIEAYEHNTVSLRDSVIYINQSPSESYTFNMDYYFMVGDNRHNSADSRIWGMVPEDHIVGKAIFVWLSVDKAQKSFKKFRWKRMFKKIR
jgi:signal peptidase I